MTHTLSPDSSESQVELELERILRPVTNLQQASSNIMNKEEQQALSFFREVINQNNTDRDVSLIVVSHILPDKIPFFSALSEAYHIAAVIPKPKSIDAATMSALSDDMGLPILRLNRQQLRRRKGQKDIFSRFAEDRQIAILDVGGYFSENTDFLHNKIDSRFLGVVEDTENGHQKYQNVLSQFPIISVARSPLKEPEDHLVGQSIVFSSDAFLRENNSLILNKRVAVIGYGKIGRSIADTLSYRRSNLCVYDHDPVRMVQAKSHGHIVGARDALLSDVDVIFCATGNRALSPDDFVNLKDGCQIISVTSRDDEFGNLHAIPGFTHNKLENGHRIFTSRKYNKSICLVNDGNAVNFIHNAVVGPYIYLVQSEILFGLMRLMEGHEPHKISELSQDDRQYLARTWLNFFGS